MKKLLFINLILLSIQMNCAAAEGEEPTTPLSTRERIAKWENLSGKQDPVKNPARRHRLPIAAAAAADVLEETPSDEVVYGPEDQKIKLTFSDGSYITVNASSTKDLGVIIDLNDIINLYNPNSNYLDYDTHCIDKYFPELICSTEERERLFIDGLLKLAVLDYDNLDINAAQQEENFFTTTFSTENLFDILQMAVGLDLKKEKLVFLKKLVFKQLMQSPWISERLLRKIQSNPERFVDLEYLSVLPGNLERQKLIFNELILELIALNLADLSEDEIKEKEKFIADNFSLSDLASAEAFFIHFEANETKSEFLGKIFTQIIRQEKERLKSERAASAAFATKRRLTSQRPPARKWQQSNEGHGWEVLTP